MTNFKKGQEILLRWFRHNAHKKITTQKLRLICINIDKEFKKEDNRYRLYHYLFPLVRMGLVEFCGKDCYRLSKPALVLYRKKLIGVNLPDADCGKLKDEIFNAMWCNSIIYFKADAVQKIEAVCGLKAVRLKPDFLFRQLPPIESFIKQIKTHKTENISDNDITSLQIWRNSSWNKCVVSDLETACYRFGDNDGVLRYLRLGQDEWYTVPDREQNPDAINLACCYCLLHNNINAKIVYDANMKTLVFENIRFPILIERLLWLLHLDDWSKANREQYKATFKNVDRKYFKMLNKFFKNKIKING